MLEVDINKWVSFPTVSSSSNHQGQGEIGQVPQNHYNAITSDLPYQGAIYAYLLRSARATHMESAPLFCPTICHQPSLFPDRKVPCTAATSSGLSRRILAGY